MIFLNVEQGSQAWYRARMGLPTASRFDKVVTPKGLKPSDQSTGLRNHLLAEWLLGEPIAEEGSQYMARGTDLEQEARDWYEMAIGAEVSLGGFCLRDDKRVGCSPDGMIGDMGLVQIKVPSAANHVGYLLDGNGDKYRLQMQGELMVTGRSWVDFLSYNPKLPPALVRVHRDPDVIHALEVHLAAFCDRLAASREELLARGYAPRTPAGFNQPGGIFSGVG